MLGSVADFINNFEQQYVSAQRFSGLRSAGLLRFVLAKNWILVKTVRISLNRRDKL